MHEFYRAMMKTAVIFCIVAAVLLTVLAVVLIAAPGLVGQVLRLGLIILCVMGAGGLIVFLVRLWMTKK